MPSLPEMTRLKELPSRLCTSCGLCCNGVLFGDVRLASSDPVERLVRLGVQLGRTKGNFQLKQPCPALCATGCTIYQERPSPCRLFECRLLKKAAQGAISRSEALKIILETRKKVGQIERLLLKLGESETG